MASMHVLRVEWAAIGLLLLVTITHAAVTTKATPNDNNRKTPIRPCIGNDTNCAMHVFRVALTQKPENFDTILGDIPLKPVKKYGANVYAPKGFTPSKQVKEQIIASIPQHFDPNLRDTVEDRIEQGEFILKESSDDPQETAQWPRVILPTQPRIPVAKKEEDSDSVPVFLLVVLLACGVVIGVLLTFFCLYMVDYVSKPTFDRSQAITFRRACDSHRYIRDRIAAHQTPSRRPLNQTPPTNAAPPTPSAPPRNSAPPIFRPPAPRAIRKTQLSRQDSSDIELQSLNDSHKNSY